MIHPKPGRTFRTPIWTLLIAVAATLGSNAAFAATSFDNWGKFSGFYVNSERDPLIPMIDMTKRTLDIEIYTMRDPQVLASIARAVKRGVKVRVIQDATPFESNVCPIFSPPAAGDEPDCGMMKSFVHDMLAHGATYVPFNKEELCAKTNGYTSCFQHGKMIIADRNAVLVSTGNFDRSNLCHPASHSDRCNRDYTMVSANPRVVQTFGAVFEKDLIGKRYDVRTVIPAPLRRTVTVSPFSLEPLVEFIATAKKSIYLQNQYVTDKILNEALVAAAGRGVKVYVQVSSVCAFGRPNDRSIEQTKAIYTAFDQAGIYSRFFTDSIRVNGQPGYLHAKAIVIDDKAAWVGSVNGSTMALTQNREFGLFFADARMVQALTAVFRHDFNDPAGETWRESIECAKDHPIE